MECQEIPASSLNFLLICYCLAILAILLIAELLLIHAIDDSRRKLKNHCRVLHILLLLVILLTTFSELALRQEVNPEM